MAKFSLTSIFEDLIGKLNRKDKIIYRRTRRYDAQGRLVLEEKHAYTQVDQRNFKKKPPRGAEKQNMEIMAEAQRLTNQYLSSESSELAELRERFYKQLDTGKPDPDAPILKKTGKRKIYTQFDRFVYALIYNRLRQQANNNE
jgi:hypothetical protein